MADHAFPLPDPPLADDVVVLRPPRDADVPALFDACQDPDIQRFTFVPHPYERAHAEAWVAAAPSERAGGIALSLVIADASDDAAVLGTVGLMRPDWDHRTVEVGYWVAPWARGRGAAGRAAGLLARWAIRALGFARVTADVDVDNVASQKTAVRAGFQREGVLRSALEMKGRRWTLVAHSLIAEDL